ncbi:MAG: tRNA epoxyqueuosine(34) reductase QueG, partial [Bacteroidetes bacterium]|nr:tRNA epoxyqueuosine(34) reductase QueG [Bacteroidota bacterium]
MLQLLEITKQIKQKAIELGFDACGIAKPDMLEKEYKHLLQWLKEDKHGNMAYLEKNTHLKADPRLAFDKTKSVITLLQSYFPAELQNKDAYYKIAKYAYGSDYHSLLKEKSKHFIQSVLTIKPNAWLKSFTDSNQILEKAWAARCGLGWIGKNTLLINKNLGSFFFISIILTDIELEYDSPVENNCGICEACINACPVNAIEKPFNLNASRCISYLTIESKT